MRGKSLYVTVNVAWLIVCLALACFVGFEWGERIGNRDYSEDLATLQAENVELNRRLSEVAQQHDPLETLEFLPAGP